MKLFDIDGPIMATLSKLSDLVIVNILFEICCLPIFTIGASYTALNRVVLSISKDREGSSIVKQFFREFKSNFKKSTIITLIFGVIFTLLTACYFTANFTLSGNMAKIYTVILVIVTVPFILASLLVFNLQGNFENSIKNTIKNSFLLVIAKLHYVILMLIIRVLAIYIAFFLNPSVIGVSSFIWFVCGFSIIAYFDSFIIDKLIKDIVK